MLDSDAANKASDADAALQELGADQVAFGYVTATVTVSDHDALVAEEKLRLVERVIQGRGFITIAESLNAVEAWLSSIPGNAYANVRQPLISTLNLAHLMPVSAVWAGPARNDHLDGPPLVVTRTDGATPFRLVTHIGDVGHTLVAGPTGMGKSVLLATLALQFRRYPGSRLFLFDMGRSLRATVLGLGGEHYDLGGDGDLAFQPLARIDQAGYRAWAAEWLEARLLQERVAVNPEQKAALWTALDSLAGAPEAQRTLTGLCVLLQDNALRQALQPYVLGGAHGQLLDADRDRLGAADVQCVEMEELMHSKAAVAAVLSYLFARFEERFDGAPTLLILDEAWLFLDDPLFAARIRQWLKTLRKKNVSVIFATQSLADIQDSSIAAAIVESCASRLFLPNPQASEPQIRGIYQSFGLNDRQIEIIAQATPKRDYYYQSRLGNRLFDLDLGPVTLAFAASASPAEQREISRILQEAGSADFAVTWLRHRGLDWAADLLACSPHTARRTCHDSSYLPFSARHPVDVGPAGIPAGQRPHRDRPHQPHAEHPDRGAHPGADQQPDQPVAERNPDVAEPGPPLGDPGLQRGQSAAREPRQHRAIAGRGPGAGVRRPAPGPGVCPPVSGRVCGQRHRRTYGAGGARALAAGAGRSAHRPAGTSAGGAEPGPGRACWPIWCSRASWPVVRCRRPRPPTSCWPYRPSSRSRPSSCRSPRTAPSPWSLPARRRQPRRPANCGDASWAVARPTRPTRAVLPAVRVVR